MSCLHGINFNVYQKLLTPFIKQINRGLTEYIETINIKGKTLLI